MQMERPDSSHASVPHHPASQRRENADKIAYVLCTGSRDASVGNPICSPSAHVLHQAGTAPDGARMADVTIYYLNIRSFGKRL